MRTCKIHAENGRLSNRNIWKLAAAIFRGLELFFSISIMISIGICDLPLISMRKSLI
jgi:hypothetical protein